MLNVNSKKPLTVGVFILALYLIGNGMLHREEVRNRTAWTNVIDAAPEWLDQTTQRMGISFSPSILLEDNNFDPTTKVEQARSQDLYYERAISNGTGKLRNYLKSTYNIPDNDVVAILTSVFRYSHEHNVTPELVFSVIDSESGFRTDAKSNMGARGLMQVLPVWHQEKIRLNGGSNELLWNPQFNIKIGTQILHDYIIRSRGDIYEALARYNGSLGGDNGYPEKILRGEERYKKLMFDIK